MKKLILLLCAFAFLSSCSSDDDDADTNTELVGEWKLIEVLADPGDGSGTFSAVESEKKIRFHQDGTITSNGTICDLSIEANNSTSGTYSLVDSTFKSPYCYDSEFNYQFEHNGNTLIIIYPCFEGCMAKYRKI